VLQSESVASLFFGDVEGEVDGNTNWLRAEDGTGEGAAESFGNCSEVIEII